jgi:hypothetical protein
MADSRRVFISRHMIGALAFLSGGRVLEAAEMLKNFNFRRSEISNIIQLYAAQLGEHLKYEKNSTPLKFEMIQNDIDRDILNKKYIHIDYFILTRAEIIFLMSHALA